MARCIEIKNSSEKIVAGRYFGFGRTDVAESAEAIVSVRATTQETGTNLSPDIRLAISDQILTVETSRLDGRD